jgi:hypothetical protein
MTEKFVVRLMDDSDRLLAWTEIQCESKPQGGRKSCPFWPKGLTQFAIEQDGLASKIVIHWCDLDIARVAAPPVEPVPVSVGQVFTYNWIEPVWLVPAMDKEIVLPAPTARASVTIAPPTGALFGIGN